MNGESSRTSRDLQCVSSRVSAARVIIYLRMLAGITTDGCSLPHPLLFSSSFTLFSSLLRSLSSLLFFPPLRDSPWFWSLPSVSPSLSPPLAAAHTDKIPYMRVFTRG